MRPLLVAVLRKHLPPSAPVHSTRARRDAQRAAGLFAEAAGGWLAYGQLLEHGRALLGAGRCRARLGDPGGRAALRDAHALFGRLGAQPLAAEAERLLHATQGDAAQS